MIAIEELILGSKVAEALSTSPARDVAFAGLFVWSKAAKALSTAARQET
jgi:hypothetical protein